MSDETTASAPAEAPTSTASAPEGAPPPESASAPQGGAEGAPEGSSDEEVVAAIEAAEDAGAETVTIGGVEVPLAALSDIPDDVLGKVRRKVKVSGEEREVSLAEALQAVSLAGGAQDKMREAARLRKEAEAALARVVEDPIGSIEQIAQMRGISREQARAAVERQLLEALEYEGLPPEERAELDKRRELEAKAKAYEEWQRQQQEQRAQQQHRQHVEQLGSALDSALSEVGLGGDSYATRRAASLMEGLIAAEGQIPQQQLTAAMKRAAQMVREEIEADRRSVFDADDDGALLERIPPEVARRIARAYAQRVKASAKPKAHAPEGTPRQKKPSKSEVSFAELRAELERRDREGAW